MIDRRGFLGRMGGVLALAFVDGVPRLASHADPHGGHVHRFDLEHPDPRPGVTAERVLPAEKLGKSPSKKVLESFDASRAYPELFDGIACGCSCGGKNGEHRSLLVCFETMQPTGCWACQQEALLVGRLAKEGKPLSEIRAAVDKEFG